MGRQRGQTPVKKTRRRKWCRRLLLLMLLLALSPFALWFSTGWWFPPLLLASLRWTPIAAETVTYTADGRLQVSGIHYAADGTEARVRQLQLPAPGQMISACLAKHRLPDITIDGWQLVIQPAEQPETPPTETPPAEIHLPETLSHWIGLLQQWRWLIPTVTLRSGMVSVAGETVAVDPLIWRDDTLTLTADSDEWPSPVTARFTVNADDSIDSIIELSSLELLLGTRIAADANTAALDSTLQWVDNVARLAVEWPQQGILPSRVTVDVPDFTIPADMLQLDGYQQPVISMTARGTMQAYSASIQISAHPADGQTLPPLRLGLEASGSESQLEIHAISIEGDFVNGSLSQPVHFDFAKPDSLNASRFDFAANLDRQNIIPLNGKLHGSIVIPEHTITDGAVPAVTIDFTAKALQWETVSVDSLTAQARLEWPILSIDTLELHSAAATADITATINILEQAIEQGTFAVTVTPLITDLFPEISLPFPFGSAHSEGTVSGTLADLSHNGSLRIEAIELPTVGTGTISADWHGTTTTLNCTIEAVLDNLHADAHIAVSQSSATEWRALIESARIQPTHADALALAEPVTVSIDISSGETDALIPFRTTMSTLALVRDSVEVLSLHIPNLGPDSGDINLRIHGLRHSDAGSLLNLPPALLAAEIHTLDLALQWDQGPLAGTLLLETTAEVENLPTLSANLSLIITDQAIELSTLSLAQDGKPALSGSARLPATLSLVDSEYITVNPAAPVSAEFTTDPDARAWTTVEQLSGARITRPRLSFNLSGSPQSPRGAIRFDATSIALPDVDLPIDATIEDLHLNLLIQPDGLNLEMFTLSLLDHPVTARGNWPISQKQWIELLASGTPPPHSNAHAEVALSNFPLATFSELLPEIVRPQGTASATLTYDGSDGLTGLATLRDAATFPLPSIGAVTNIRSDITITNHILNLESLTARIGGETLRLSGTIDIHNPDSPRLNLHATAQNLPLLRSPGLIMRAEDIDIHITTGEDDLTAISGTVRMAESFLLVDFNDLRASTTSADNPPPFFAVEDEPFAQWTLNVNIIGDRFLRVSTPVFDGIISADFNLGGNLGTPLSHGVASVQRGFIKFPFALFTVSQGEVAIDPSAPQTIRLNLDASGRSYGYDLRMQVSGTAAEPILQFSSTPTLENADILLLVTAGRIPQGGTEMSSSSRLSGLGLFLGSTFLAELGLVDPYSDRLRIRIGEDVSAQGRDTIQVEFRINERASIIGEYDRFDAYNLDFKYLIYSRQ